jgi:hypothetical protein
MEGLLPVNVHERKTWKIDKKKNIWHPFHFGKIAGNSKPSQKARLRRTFEAFFNRLNCDRF